MNFFTFIQIPLQQQRIKIFIMISVAYIFLLRCAVKPFRHLIIQRESLTEQRPFHQKICWKSWALKTDLRYFYKYSCLSLWIFNFCCLLGADDMPIADWLMCLFSSYGTLSVFLSQHEHAKTNCLSQYLNLTKVTSN